MEYVLTNSTEHTDLQKVIANHSRCRSPSGTPQKSKTNQNLLPFRGGREWLRCAL